MVLAERGTGLSLGKRVPGLLPALVCGIFDGVNLSTLINIGAAGPDNYTCLS